MCSGLAGNHSSEPQSVPPLWFPLQGGREDDALHQLLTRRSAHVVETEKGELYNALIRARVCADTQTFHYHLIRLHAASSRTCINIPETIETEVTKLLRTQLS